MFISTLVSIVISETDRAFAGFEPTGVDFSVANAIYIKIRPICSFTVNHTRNIEYIIKRIGVHRRSMSP